MMMQVKQVISSGEFINGWTRYFCSTSVMNEQLAMGNLHMLLGQTITIYDHDNRMAIIKKFNLQRDQSEGGGDGLPDIDDLELNDDGGVVGLPSAENIAETIVNTNVYLPIIIKFHGNYYDLRTHLNYIQDSGTGKSEGNTQVMAVGSVIGLNIKKITITTDAGLIGDNENQVGVLTKSEIILVDEAQEFYADSSKLSKDKAKVRDVLNEAMNVAGTYMSVISKELKHEDYEVFPLSSFILTSYETDNMFALAQSTGFFQRSLTYNRELTYDEYKKMQNLHTRGLFIDPVSREELVYTEKMKAHDEKLVFSYFKRIKAFLRTVDSNKVVRTINPNNKDTESAKFYIPVRLIELTSEKNMKLRNLTIQSVLRFENFYDELVEHLSEEIKRYTMTFFSRMKGHMLRLAIHHAIMNFRILPTTSDFSYGQNHAQIYMRNIVEWVERWSEKDKKVTDEAEKRIKDDNKFVTEFNLLSEYNIRKMEFANTNTEDFSDKIRMYIDNIQYFNGVDGVIPDGFEGYYPLTQFKEFMALKIGRSDSTIDKKWATAKNQFLEKTQKGNIKWIRPKEIPAGDESLDTGLDYDEQETFI